jgi:hypothetical protein
MNDTSGKGMIFHHVLFYFLLPFAIAMITFEHLTYYGSNTKSKMEKMGEDFSDDIRFGRHRYLLTAGLRDASPGATEEK